MQRNDPNNKITTIQSFVRTWNATNQYQINHLSREELKDYPAFLVGNDPRMPAELDQYCGSDKPIAVVGTSIFRVVSLALKLWSSNQGTNNQQPLPKVIIVDNSFHVLAFWKSFRLFMNEEPLAGTQALFTINIKTFLQRSSHICRPITDEDFDQNQVDKTKYLSQDVPRFFKALFEKYGYDAVRNVIIHTAVIGQSWADRETFVKLKNILNYCNIQKVFAYPSDIVPCSFDRVIQEQILQNICDLAPSLTIHTNTCFAHNMPEKVILITNPKPSQVKMKLFGMPCLYENTATERGLTLQRLLNIYFSSPHNGQSTQAFLLQEGFHLKKI